ncbi:MAG: ATPase AAA domain-containing protein 2 [Paramarteilia canceri]
MGDDRIYVRTRRRLVIGHLDQDYYEEEDYRQRKRSHSDIAYNNYVSKPKTRSKYRFSRIYSPQNGAQSFHEDTSDEDKPKHAKYSESDSDQEINFPKIKTRYNGKLPKETPIDSGSLYHKLNQIKKNFGEKDLNEIESTNNRNKTMLLNEQSELDIKPLKLDSNINFNSLGGMASHLEVVKELIILPMIYPDLYSKFGINSSKGILFFGPPGTGKTLMARSIASECDKMAKKIGKSISFFARKGADIFSKWVGETEKNLSAIFKAASDNRPSILFFDEIDGLAPKRGASHDHVHNSTVATFLALLDGLESRGDIIVIGATNRIDSIDSALRRPGRFDRELKFDLPDEKARFEILKIQTEKWEPKPSENFLKSLSKHTSNFCGADLKGLCDQAVLNSIKRIYPQIYGSKNRLKIDKSKVYPSPKDFLYSLNAMNPKNKEISTNELDIIPEGISYPIKFLIKEQVAYFKELLKSFVYDDESVYSPIPDDFIHSKPPIELKKLLPIKIFRYENSSKIQKEQYIMSILSNKYIMKASQYQDSMIVLKDDLSEDEEILCSIDIGKKDEILEEKSKLMRDLRMYLREITRSIYKPVDLEEVPDYSFIIKEPMCLQYIMKKIDSSEYTSFEDFLCDVELIVNNALEYNPEVGEDIMIRHKAHDLRDFCLNFIEKTIDPNLVERIKLNKTALNKINSIESQSKTKENSRKGIKTLVSDDENEKEPISIISESSQNTDTNYLLLFTKEEAAQLTQTTLPKFINSGMFALLKFDSELSKEILKATEFNISKDHILKFIQDYN